MFKSRRQKNQERKARETFLEGYKPSNDVQQELGRVALVQQLGVGMKEAIIANLILSENEDS